ncbi:unnamed protein product [Linum tenue]|uniref:Uncharacterized protein n=1 Tax=Linum tenue TaxID=586396 RepID=A0AAV0J435_9ROSI|nr:unnamed protein product [Linum tenue]
MFLGGGRGMGGIGGGGVSGGGGGNIIRGLGRAVTRAGVAGDPISPTSAPNSPAPAAAAASPSSRQARKPTASGSGSGSGLTLSAGPGGALPIGWTTSALAAPYGSPFDEYGRDWEWVSADGSSSDDKEVIYGLTDEYLALAPPPSADEVHTAVDELSEFVGSGRYRSLIRDRYGNERMDDEIWWSPKFASSSSSIGLELDWKEPSPNLSGISRPYYGTDAVYRAFHLLQSDQSVQRMVTSLSSDAAIWDAVMNNEVVRELRQAYDRDENSNTNSMSQESASDDETVSYGDEDVVGNKFVKWILDNVKARVVALIESLSELVNKVVVPRGEDGGGRVGEGAAGMAAFERKVVTSLLLSVVVMLVVVVSRSQKG